MIKPKKISEKKIYSNGYLKVLEKIYKEEDGSDTNVLVLAKDNKVSEGVFVIPITYDGKIIYTKEYRHGPDKVVIGFPAGTKDDGVSIDECVKSELLEETGYTTGNIVKLTETIFEHYVEGTAYLYLATECNNTGERFLESGENIDVFITSPANFEKMILNGEVEVAKAIAMFYLAKAKTDNFTNFNL